MPLPGALGPVESRVTTLERWLRSISTESGDLAGWSVINNTYIYGGAAGARNGSRTTAGRRTARPANGTIMTGLARPIPGARITQRFGENPSWYMPTYQGHEGIDFSAAVGTPVRAAHAGAANHYTN